jgi:hypothetical protein
MTSFLEVSSQQHRRADALRDGLLLVARDLAGQLRIGLEHEPPARRVLAPDTHRHDVPSLWIERLWNHCPAFQFR